MLFNLAIRFPSALYVLEASRSLYALHAHRMHAEYSLANLDDDVDLE